MSLEHLDVVHVGLPVLDVAAVVRRQHPHVIVRPGHSPHRTVVGLWEEGSKIIISSQFLLSQPVMSQLVHCRGETFTVTEEY